VFHRLVTLKYPAALLCWHAIEVAEAIQHVLLRLGWKIAEAGFVLQGTLLLSKREIAVTVHPLGQVFLILLGFRGRIRRGRS
jgi:hypothetical protein